MYASKAGQASLPPKLLLLDEPDGVLHPQMVQKFHAVVRALTEGFGLQVIFTTHSPTTIALFDAGPIWRVSESSLMEVEKDAAISELLVGLEGVFVHYAKARPVYVESHMDAEVYAELFAQSRRWLPGPPAKGALRFIPSGPKLPTQNMRQLVAAHLGVNDPDAVERFVAAINGQGDCSKVYGAVEVLNAEGGTPVHGIVDWDLSNRGKSRVHVLGSGLFYSIESAVLNPLTLGLYLVHNYASRVPMAELGLPADVDTIGLYDNPAAWQAIADAVTCRALGVSDVKHDAACEFPGGRIVQMDHRYVHMNGHALHDRLLGEVFPFLKGKRPSLILDVVRQGMGTCSGRTMPMEFPRLFDRIIASTE